MDSTDGTSAPSPTESNGNNFNPSMAIIIVVLVGALLLVLIFSMYIRRCTRGTEDQSNSRVAPTHGDGSHQSIHFYERPGGDGLERALVDALPLVSFSVVKSLKAGKEDLECSVCLEKFAEEDELLLRLLPKCSHVFHTECIDVWFLSHSTCPLCRTSLKPTLEEISAGVPEVGEVSRRILAAQEIFGSARHDALNPLEALEGSGGEIGRDGERTSARLALFRNSDSFRQAARGVEVRERLATLSARYPASSSVDDHVEPKAPQRASSLSCVNFSLPRTSSSGAAEEFYNPEIFKYGSQRYGLNMTSHLGRLGSLNEPPGEELAASTSNGDAPAVKDVSTTPDAPRGTVSGKQPQVNASHHRKSGSAWTDRGSFLRGSFSLRRSASEGRAHSFDVEPQLPAPPSEPTAAVGGAHSDNNSSFAQRTILWLSGGNKHARSRSARASSDHRNELQQVVTE